MNKVLRILGGAAKVVIDIVFSPLYWFKKEPEPLPSYELAVSACTHHEEYENACSCSGPGVKPYYMPFCGGPVYPKDEIKDSLDALFNQSKEWSDLQLDLIILFKFNTLPIRIAKRQLANIVVKDALLRAKGQKLDTEVEALRIHQYLATKKKKSQQEKQLERKMKQQKVKKQTPWRFISDDWDVTEK